MGKYMRKAKTAGEVAVMDVTQSSLGVRTRARTLALQRLQQKSQPAPAPGGGSYLQLRSRRLEKPPVLVNESSRRTRQGNAAAKEKDAQNSNANSRARVKMASADSGPRESGQKENSDNGKKKEIVQEDNDNDLGIEASFGENVLESEGRERSTRESTPCSLIRDPETIRTPGSSNRPTSSMENRRARSSASRHIPTAHEMDQFFADAEEEQRRQFIEKYNYDPVNDKPLPGHFEWKKVDHP
ncbi:Cyclin-dependent kinase inhibitor [Melia azedarach]|uniref:Cyclin-dependent kinase inhibitor n=1 Tax=Melia azedarach TaxID=155640 RepID=A0ACC1YHQ2_MELAZ|nr:Cyclin-dependent kinase inhibitor [Melia azedarach]